MFKEREVEGFLKGPFLSLQSHQYISSDLLSSFIFTEKNKIFMTYKLTFLGTCVPMPYLLVILAFAAGVLLPMEMLLVQ